MSYEDCHLHISGNDEAGKPIEAELVVRILRVRNVLRSRDSLLLFQLVKSVVP
jgi:hypothetical protein